MGMYTYFIIKGTVKKEYREKIGQIYDYPDENENFEQIVRNVGLDLLYEFSKGERCVSIFYGSVDSDESICEYDKDTGYWHIECDIKNYSENGKPKNSMALFRETIPKLFEEGMFFSEHYEEMDIPTKWELRYGELVCINSNEVDEEISKFGYGEGRIIK